MGEPPWPPPILRRLTRTQLSGDWWLISAWCRHGTDEKRANSRRQAVSKGKLRRGRTTGECLRRRKKRGISGTPHPTCADVANYPSTGAASFNRPHRIRLDV